AVRAARDPKRVESALAALQRGCAGTDNVMPLLLDCAHAYCTIEEMIGTMKAVFGEYHDPGIY
ncbi:MAG: methylmalonyl-CoA mutase, partial [Deltaproteobacteria bacterium]|nr:methylmalonyl-CoA mutase [Deltaproteobacteria bacterium]